MSSLETNLVSIRYLPMTLSDELPDRLWTASACSLDSRPVLNNMVVKWPSSELVEAWINLPSLKYRYAFFSLPSTANFPVFRARLIRLSSCVVLKSRRFPFKAIPTYRDRKGLSLNLGMVYYTLSRAWSQPLLTTNLTWFKVSSFLMEIGLWEKAHSFFWPLTIFSAPFVTHHKGDHFVKIPAPKYSTRILRIQ